MIGEYWPGNHTYPWWHYYPNRYTWDEKPCRPQPRNPPVDVDPLTPWPPNWTQPVPVLSDGSQPPVYALLAGFLGHLSYGWHSLQGMFLNMETAMQAVADEWLHAKGTWWQIIHLLTGEIVASGTNHARAADFEAGESKGE